MTAPTSPSAPGPPGPLRLQYSALSDVGRVRKDNQDSGYAGPHLLVIADGVGGAARGDVASSQAVEVLRRLDQPPSSPPGDSDAEVEASLGSLSATIHLCHDRISELVASQPELEGTSTTVTAAVFDGTRIAVGHVGDSRGYLLREGTLAQLTTDHTFVQSLIDEGRITEEEARTHPHRNLILRAVDGVHEPQPDVFALELAEGDRILLCSDGASGVLADDELNRILGDGPPDHAALSLLNRALEAGSTDNVTVVVADVVDAAAPVDPDSAVAATGPMLVGAAAEGPRGLRPGPPASDDTGELPTTESEPGGRPVGRATTASSGGAAASGEVDPEEARYAPRPPRRFLWLRRVAVLVVLALAVGLIGVAAYRWSQDRYFVGVEGERVVIFRGVEADLPGIALNSVHEETDLLLEDLPDAYARRVREGVTAPSLEAARNIVTDYEGQVSCPDPEPEEAPGDGPDSQPGADASPNASPGASPEPSPGPGAEAEPDADPEAAPSPTRTPAVCLERP